MFYVGEVSDEARRLCEVAKACMEAGIAQCRPGARVRNIGKARTLARPRVCGRESGRLLCGRKAADRRRAQAIEDLAHANKYKVCPEFVGHGVGRWFHAAPLVLPVGSDLPDTMQARHRPQA